MAYKIDFKDLEKIEKLMDTYADKAIPIAKQMVYVGAGDVADSIRSSLLREVSDEATGELAEGLDVKDIEVDGTNVGTKIRFVGYDSKGVPLGIIAAVLESGRSDQPNRHATHFISKGVMSSRKQALDDMANKFDEIIEKISKSGD